MKAITTRYHGPTDMRGARISAFDGDSRVYIGYPPELSLEEAHRKAAERLCEKLQWTGHLVGGATKDGYVWVFCDVQGTHSH